MDRRHDDEESERFFLWSEELWDMTCIIAAMVHNTTRTEQRDCKKPDEFNPTLQAGGMEQSDAGTEAAFEFAAEQEAKKREAAANGE